LVIMGLFCVMTLAAYSDDVPKIKANWSLEDKTITLHIANLGSKPIKISPMGAYQNRSMTDIDISDLDRIGFIQHDEGVIDACIIFFMKDKHPELASSSMGGRIPDPDSIPAGEQHSIKFPLDANFSSVAGFADKIKLLLIYNNQIIDISQLAKKGDNFYNN